MKISDEAEQLSLFGLDSFCGRTCREPSQAAHPKVKTSGSSLKRSLELVSIPFQSLDLTPGVGNLLGESYWELVSPWRGESLILNTGPAPRSAEDVYSLSQILQAEVPLKYYLSPKACLGILRRARERGKELPPQLKYALQIQAGLPQTDSTPTMELKAYHINQRDEGIDLQGVSGALMATNNMQMQTFVTGEPVAFAANQRDEVRDLHNIAGALSSQPGMKQQTFIATGALNPWDTQQQRVFTEEGIAPTLAGADGKGGRNPAGLLFAAGVVSKGNGDCFLTEECHTSLSSGGGQAGQGYPFILAAGASPTAGNIGWQEECSPTLKAGESGTNMVPSVLCLNDQGGRRMDITENQTSTLRAQMGGHQPLICLNDQGGGVMDCSIDVTGTLRAQEHGHQPLVFENHGIDSRYTGPHKVAPTMSARYGTGGNNVPLVMQEHSAICIAGNIIDRQPENGGNGFGYQEDLSYTLTATDKHAVMFSRQRVDVFKDDDVASTQSARQHKDATDLVCQQAIFGQSQFGNYSEGCATLRAQGGDNGGGSENLVTNTTASASLLIRRLTPLECERLQGFPDGWTNIPNASDAARYKALGNSVAIPCVEYIMHGLALVLSA